MSNPEEKAKELYEIFGLKAVDVVNEILNTLYQFCYTNTWYDDFESDKMVNADQIDPTRYWYNVKEHLITNNF